MEQLEKPKFDKHVNELDLKLKNRGGHINSVGDTWADVKVAHLLGVL